MRVIKIEGENIGEALSAAVKALRGGGIVAYPTETYYGLGAKFDLADSLGRLHALKRRPVEKAMPLIIGGKEILPALTQEVNPTARALMERFWPGPLTILFPAAGGLSEYIVSNGKVAVRVPGESFALRLARAAGFPMTATSANPSGLPPAQDAEAVIAYFGSEIDLVVDGGTTPGGLPSTVVEALGDRVTVIRRGAIEPSALEAPREEPMETAHEAKAAYEEVSSFIERHTSSVCPSCENVCCIDRHGSYGQDDLLFLRALGEAPPEDEAREKDTEPCRFLTPRGCRLPRWRRPFRCTWYFCGRLLEAMPGENPRRYREFIRALNRLIALRQEAIGLYC